MKNKRILSFLLALLMLFSILPFSALAEEDGLDEPESVSEENAFDPADPFAGLTEENESAPPEEESGTEEEPPASSDSEEAEEENSFADETQDADEDWESEETSQESDVQTGEETEADAEPEEDTEIAPEPDDSSDDEGQEEPDDADDSDGEEEESLESSEDESWAEAPQLQEPDTVPDTDLSLDDLVLTEYDGSYIWYAIENCGQAYVKTKQETAVYRDSSMNPDAVLCTLPGGEILLATDYDEYGGCNAVFVAVVTPEMDVLEGYVRESDLCKTVVEDAEIDLILSEQDYIMIDVNGVSYPVLVSAASFYGAASENETDDEAAYENDGVEDEPETITLDPDVQEIQPAVPVRLMATRSYTYTIYADHDPAIPISTRPVAYMAGNRQGFTTIDQGNDGSDFRSIHESYNMKGQQVTVLGFTRYHHAVITCEWYDSSAGVTRRLLTEAAYMRPVAQTYSCTVRDDYGNIVPNHEVRVLDGKGNYVTTVMSDANGVARYTGPHLEVSAMLAFAEANYTETSSNTMIEDNDCASFVSECLTAGGFPVYGAYASNSEANEGQIGYGLYDRLVSWIGVPGTSYPSVSQLSPGDVVFMHPQNSANYPYGHSMIIGQVDYASGQVLVYGHSSANKQAGDSNKMWISVGRIAYAAFTSIYNYTFDYSFSTPTPPPTNPPTQPPTQPPTNPPTNPPTQPPTNPPTQRPTATPTPVPAKGRIRVIKTDAVYGTPIAGVIFDISLNGTVVGTMTTDANGTATSGELPAGKYDVTERSTPTGYTGLPFWSECNVTSNNTTELKVTNQPIQFRVKIIKSAVYRHPKIHRADSRNTHHERQRRGHQ